MCLTALAPPRASGLPLRSEHLLVTQQVVNIHFAGRHKLHAFEVAGAERQIAIDFGPLPSAAARSTSTSRTLRLLLERLQRADHVLVLWSSMSNARTTFSSPSRSFADSAERSAPSCIFAGSL